MDMSGERLIAAPRDKVWAALNDPDILKACIPGCERLEKVCNTEMKLITTVELGSIAARFTGNLLLSALDPPNGYTISGEGQGDNDGLAKGGAKLALLEAAGSTRLTYTANAEGSGEFARLDPGAADAAAREYAETFFTRFAGIVTTTSPAGPATAAQQLKADGKAPETVLPGLEQVPAGVGTPPYDPAAHETQPKPFHPPAHEDHDHDPSNPHYFGLPVGVIIAATVAAISVCITLYKFIG